LRDRALAALLGRPQPAYRSDVPGTNACRLRPEPLIRYGNRMLGRKGVDHLPDAVASEEDRKCRRLGIALVESDESLSDVPRLRLLLSVRKPQGGLVGGQLPPRLPELVARAVPRLNRRPEARIERVHLVEDSLGLSLLGSDLVLRRGRERLPNEHGGENRHRE
jgi:hypothetical protein